MGGERSTSTEATAASRTRSANGASAQAIDHPGFVQKMAKFVSSHPRVETIIYYRSQSGSTFDLGVQAERPRGLQEATSCRSAN